VLITSICNAAGCWGSHSQFLCQCAKSAHKVKGSKEARKKKKEKKKKTIWKRESKKKKKWERVKLCNPQLSRFGR